jgi:(E)-4-hydroxy-3-methylbut-2-enyl-diphosphate synthase
MSRYGDTPEGIVESCMEFLRICRQEHFDDVVISIKASNTVIMVRSVRLLVSEMDKEGMSYPLHLGVTEAGEGEDGRIKSAVGIGALLADGIGDTIRVSLSEEPEYEIPVARHLVDYIGRRAGHMLVPGLECEGFDYLRPERRNTRAVMNIGGENLPVVITDRMDGGVKLSSEFTPDYIYCGRALPEKREKCAYIIDADMYQGEENTYPAFPYNQLPLVSTVHAPLKFLFLPFGAPSDEYLACLKQHPEIVVISQSNHQNRLGEQRALIHELMCNGILNPVVIFQHYQHSQEEKSDFQLEAAADMGPLMFDGLCDGVYLFNHGSLSHDDIDATAFGILQAARLRTVKTEYISCPGCGRTLYDLQDTIRRIKEATKEFKGLKIGIMGCIVNGPGEMADADYGYVGAARGKVSLYRRKECIEKNISEEEAVDKLLQLIRNDLK